MKYILMEQTERDSDQSRGRRTRLLRVPQLMILFPACGLDIEATSVEGIRYNHWIILVHSLF